MANCSYCEEKVAMPFTCKLCGKKLCAKHRLPERHECGNLDHYDTFQYKQEKMEKAMDYRETKFPESSSDSAGAPRLFNQSTWTSGDVGKNVLYGGLILALMVILKGRLFESAWLVTGAIIFAPIQFYLFYILRRNYARKFYLKTEFVFSPIGIAISIITSLFRFVIIAFGFFYEEGADDEAGAKIGIRAIFSAYAIYFVGSFILGPLFLILDIRLGNLNLEILHAVLSTSHIFLWLAIILIFPWRGLDGKKIYDWDTRTYWKMLAFLIIAYIVDWLFAADIFVFMLNTLA